MFETVITEDLDGNRVELPVSSLAQTFTYDENDNLETITVVYQGVTYVQSFTFTPVTNGKMLSSSRWVAQP
jgi:hypothetical protein